MTNENKIKEYDVYDDYFEKNRLTTEDLNNLKELIEKIDPEDQLFSNSKKIIDGKLKILKSKNS